MAVFLSCAINFLISFGLNDLNDINIEYFDF